MKSYDTGSKPSNVGVFADSETFLSSMPSVVLPEGGDLNEWLAMHVIDFTTSLQLMYSSFQPFCTDDRCPQMRAGRLLYLWRCDNGGGAKALSARVYAESAFKQAFDQFRNHTIFPVDANSPFPDNFFEIVRENMKNLARIFSHCYYHHFEDARRIETEAHINTLFQHFIYFVREFNILSDTDLLPLAKLIAAFDRKRLKASMALEVSVVKEFPKIYRQVSGLRQIHLSFNEGLHFNGDILDDINRSKPYCICVTMALGSFRGYTRKSILHCGVSDSRGYVYHFNEEGFFSSPWKESINFDARGLIKWKHDGNTWDSVVHGLHAKKKARAAETVYNDVTNNCYTHVLELVNALCRRTDTPSSFSEKDIVPVLEPGVLKAEQFLRYYKYLHSRGARHQGIRAELDKLVLCPVCQSEHEIDQKCK